MFMCQCDVCGALDEAGDEPKAGTAMLMIAEAPSNDAVLQFFSRRQRSGEFYQFCRDCTAQLKALIAARREQRI